MCVFTKAMGETVIYIMRGDIPVVTIRPSVIESTFKEPFAGWKEGNRYVWLNSYVSFFFFLS